VPLLDLSLALAHARVTDTSEATLADVELKTRQAEAIVLTYLKRPLHGWTDLSNPATDAEFAIVQAAILKVFLNLWRFRGDDTDTPQGAPLTEDVRWMLSGLRDPTLA
jgi:hypothetical protein